MREKGRPCRSSRNPNLKSSGEAPAISPKVEPFRIRHGKFGKTLTVNLRLLTVLLTKAAGGDVDQLLNQKQAARILDISVRSLERHRVAGTGPRYARLGRLIRYRECDLAEWVHDSLRTSTSHPLLCHSKMKSGEKAHGR